MSEVPLQIRDTVMPNLPNESESGIREVHQVGKHQRFSPSGEVAELQQSFGALYHTHIAPHSQLTVTLSLSISFSRSTPPPPQSLSRRQSSTLRARALDERERAASTSPPCAETAPSARPIQQEGVLITDKRRRRSLGRHPPALVLEGGGYHRRDEG